MLLLQQPVPFLPQKHQLLLQKMNFNKLNQTGGMDNKNPVAVLK
jgi:hypothetical protein